MSQKYRNIHYFILRIDFILLKIAVSRLFLPSKNIIAVRRISDVFLIFNLLLLLYLISEQEKNYIIAEVSICII